MQNDKSDFQTYNDGICHFHEIDEDGRPEKEVERLRYQERTVGVRRYYEAMTAKMQIDRLIRVPFREDITTGHYAVIAGQTYKIQQVQTIADCRPKSMDISLQKIRQRRR